MSTETDPVTDGDIQLQVRRLNVFLRQRGCDVHAVLLETGPDGDETRKLIKQLVRLLSTLSCLLSDRGR